MSRPVTPAPDQEDLDITLVDLLRGLAKRGIAIAIGSNGNLTLKAPAHGIAPHEMAWIRRHHDALCRVMRSRRGS